MGRTRIIPLVVEEFTRTGWRHMGAWSTTLLGKPTDQRLEDYREKFVKSTCKGGCNEHLGVTVTGNLRVRRQKDQAILARYTAPMFEVVEG